MLHNRRIIVGICGGIASYKAIELVSQLQQSGALVDVIMTKHAEDFIQPLTFSTMSHRPVYTTLWEPSGKAAEHHIRLAEEAELLAIVPATAQTIAKLAHGSQKFWAYPKLLEFAQWLQLRLLLLHIIGLSYRIIILGESAYGWCSSLAQ